ncbi:MAG: hypothetical protein ABIS50_02485 [Luteolibacter sp.]|uniref:hypothetical protein n=1 Tax=Luteolibacter sp. TaxID=1962973 RepID=UPI0032668B37
MSEIRPHLLEGLQKMKELKLMEEILYPLFMHLGYERVDLHHGGYERGRDLILMRCNPLGGMELTVIQVKCQKLAVSTRKTNSFADLVNQLKTASETPIPLHDGSNRKPNLLVYATPFKVSTRLLESRSDGFSELASQRNVQILDGDGIATLLENSAPKLITKIVKPATFAKYLTSKYYGNRPLMVAIKSKSNADISEYYCDLEFSPGRDESNFFFDLSQVLPNKNLSIAIHESEWKKLEDLGLDISRDLIIENPFDFNIDQARLKRRNHLKQLHSQCLQLFGIIPKKNENQFANADSFTKLIKTLKDLIDEPDEKNDNEAKKKNKSRTKIQKSLTILKKPWDLVVETLSNVEIYVLKNIDDESLKSSISHFENFQIDFLNSQQDAVVGLRITEDIVAAKSLFGQTRKGLDGIAQLHQEAIRQFDENREFSVNVPFDRRSLIQALLVRRSWLEKSVDKINQNCFSDKELCLFLDTAKQTFQLLDKVSSINGLTEALIPDLPTSERLHRPILRVPLSTLFETRKNFAVFGEAGAGKTTSLQRFSQTQNSSQGSRLTLFIPLSELRGCLKIIYQPILASILLLMDR